MRRDETKSDRLWDRRAAKYHEAAQKDESYDWALERFAKYLQPDDRVLDYGCGTGIVAHKIAGDVKEVQGIDTSARMIELAKAHARERALTNVHFTRQTIFDERLVEETYGMVLALNILHLLEDPGAAVRRACELLKADGCLVSLTPCLEEAGAVLRTLLPLIAKLGVLSYLRSFRASDVESLMRDAGLEIVESEVVEGRIPSLLLIAR